MQAELVLRWLHVTGACVLLRTGAGIAFFEGWLLLSPALYGVTGAF